MRSYTIRKTPENFIEFIFNGVERNKNTRVKMNNPSRQEQLNLYKKLAEKGQPLFEEEET